MQLIWKILDFISEKLKICGAVCMMGMTVLTCLDVVGRFFKHPIYGSVELVTFMGVLVTAFALPFAHESKSHIGVELIVDRMPRKIRALFGLCTDTVSLGMFGMAAWCMFKYGFEMKASGEVSMNLKLPEYLLILLVGFSFVIFSLMIIKGIAGNVKNLMCI